MSITPDTPQGHTEQTSGGGTFGTDDTPISGCMDQIIEQKRAQIEGLFGKGFEIVSLRDALVEMRVPEADTVADACIEKNNSRGNVEAIKAFITAFTFHSFDTGRTNENPSVILNTIMTSGDFVRLGQAKPFMLGLLKSLRCLPYIRFDEVYRGMKSREGYSKDCVVTWNTFTSTTREKERAERSLGLLDGKEYGTFVVLEGVYGYDVSEYLYIKNDNEVILEPFQSLIIENVEETDELIHVNACDSGRTMLLVPNDIPVPNPIPCYEYDMLVEGLEKHKRGKHEEASDIYMRCVLRGSRIGSLNYGNFLMFGAGVGEDKERGLEYWMNGGKIEENEMGWMRELSNSRYVSRSVLDLRGLLFHFCFIIFTLVFFEI